MKLRITVLLLIAMAFARSHALINLEMPLSKIVQESKRVFIGNITAVNPDNRLLDLKTTAMVKGETIGDSFRVQIAAPAELMKDIASGQQVVVFTGEVDGRGVALVHVGNAWTMAEALPDAKPAAWRVIQRSDGRHSFNGTTAELAKQIAELKSAPQR